MKVQEALIAVIFLLWIEEERVHAFRILYPQHPLYPKQADEPYQSEYMKILETEGIDCALFDHDEFEYSGKLKCRPKIQFGETVLYRGWMMKLTQYQHFYDCLQKMGAQPITSVEDYIRCHQLPGWYTECQDLTSETVFVKSEKEIPAITAKLGWNKYFVKDYVKSNTERKGSIASSADEILGIVEDLKQYRGEIEGGISLRKFENYIPDSEQRFFVVRQTAFGPAAGNDIPHIVQKVAEIIDAPFYSVDIVKTAQGEWRVVELGDGQVSDKKEWPPARFVDEVICAIAINKD